jgi:hypothetical protein
MPVSLMKDIFAAVDDGISYRQCNLFRSVPAVVIGGFTMQTNWRCFVEGAFHGIPSNTDKH